MSRVMQVKYVAFLRAINVGGRVVKMEELKVIFRSMKFANVSTFIASGNVLFSSPETDAASLEDRISAQLAKSLGYTVATFVRRAEELPPIVAYEPFPGDGKVNVGFLHRELDADARERLSRLRTEVDEFHAHGRELYWRISDSKISSSQVSGPALEKALGMPVTFRTTNTVRRIDALMNGADAKGAGEEA